MITSCPELRGGNRERALVKLRQAVAAFEVERAGPEPLPGWGAAEAYLFLARDLMDHGDAVGARDALERALLLAPDDRQARRLMSKLADSVFQAARRHELVCIGEAARLILYGKAVLRYPVGAVAWLQDVR